MAASSTQPEIARATREDVSGILALQEENQPEYNGMLSARLPRAWFDAALADTPIIVARREGRIVGYLVSASRAAVSGVPVIAAMLLAYPGTADAYVYGPVCVAANERGGRIAEAMFVLLRSLLPQREGILFIRNDNDASLRAHRRMGLGEVASFAHDGAEFTVFSYLG